MEDQLQTLRNRLESCRELLSRGVTAPEAERLLKAILELENAIALELTQLTKLR
jgi:hypothetical protein